MFNLLPEEDKNSIRSEYRRRVIIMVLWFLLFGTLASLLLLIPSALVDFLSNDRVKNELADFKSKPEVNDYVALAKEMAATKSKLSYIQTYLPPRENVSGVIKEILDRKPKGVSIEIINWVNKEVAIEVRLNGNSTSRDLLLSFASALEESKLFGTVDVPVASYAKSEDTDFSITLQIKKKS